MELFHPYKGPYALVTGFFHPYMWSYNLNLITGNGGHLAGSWDEMAKRLSGDISPYLTTGTNYC